MKYFTESEFLGWFESTSQKQLDRLDKFRELWGAPVKISPVDGGLGRRGGASKSTHNIDRHGEVMAADIFPKGLDKNNLQRAYDCAIKAGFTGIGVYKDARPSIMMHLDSRPGRLAQWSAWRKPNGGWRYSGIAEAGIK